MNTRKEGLASCIRNRRCHTVLRQPTAAVSFAWTVCSLGDKGCHKLCLFKLFRSQVRANCKLGM